jgi:opacity protein-like surface antigen
MKRFALTLVVAALLAPAACAEKKVQMQTSSGMPAAEGKAVLEHDRNGNVEVKLTVHHLAKPENLSPAKQAYVVWVQPEGEQPVNEGALRVNDELKGEFRTRTPYKKFDIFVTAEDTPTATSPTGPEVMRQHMQDK